MRLVFSMASLLVISLLIFNGYANGSADDRAFEVGDVRAQPIASAKNIPENIKSSVSTILPIAAAFIRVSGCSFFSRL